MPMKTRPNLLRWCLLLGALLAAWASAPSASAQTSGAPPDERPNPQDLLGNLVVVAGGTRPLPKIAVQPSLESNIEDVTIYNVIRRDLELCGEFDLLPESVRLDGLLLSDTPVDVKAWAAKGADAIVKVNGRALGGGKAELRGLAYFASSGDKPVFDRAFVVDAAVVRDESHRMADALIGALTGTPGGFYSDMTFVYGTYKDRRAYAIDADGHDPKPMSRDAELVIGSAFGPGQKLFYAASVNNDAYRVLTPDSTQPAALNVPGSVYGLAFSPARDRVAVAIAQRDTIELFAGPDLGHLSQASRVPLAMQPTFTSSGKVAFVGAGRWSQRVFVEGKAISPDGLSASSPTFCKHPDGARAIFAVGVGMDTDLVATGESGGGLVRLTQGQGRNNYPACSPDGRLVAFFSTRKSGEGPGLYIMRIDGQRPKRISTLVGDSLSWARLPEPTATR
jgi:TolB protein